MTTDRTIEVKHEELEALVREELERGLAPFHNEALTDRTRDAMQARMADVLARLAHRGDTPPDYFRTRARATPEQIAMGAVSVYAVRNFAAYPMTESEFEEMFGRAPAQDDLHRINCRESGAVGHYLCGWCMDHEGPRFSCGCVGLRRREAP